MLEKSFLPTETSNVVKQLSKVRTLYVQLPTAHSHIHLIAVEIGLETGNKNVELWLLDLAKFASVRSFADRFEKEGERLDILVENAAVTPSLDGVIHPTVDGWEPTSVLHKFYCRIKIECHILILQTAGKQPGYVITRATSPTMHVGDSG